MVRQITHAAPQVKPVAARLSDRYGDFAHFNRTNPLEELLFILCSIQTNEALYRRTYRSLRRRFPRFSDFAMADESEIAGAIAEGGLSKQKARKIKSIIRAVAERFGRPSLAALKVMTDSEREEVLLALPGVGKKTARCVMMYSLGSPVFPVDVHCWRICQRLGWVRPTRRDKSCSPRDMDRLQAKIPPNLRFSLHVNMVSLGRDICTAGTPDCDSCPIRSYCKRSGVRVARST